MDQSYDLDNVANLSLVDEPILSASEHPNESETSVPLDPEPVPSPDEPDEVSLQAL